MLTIEHRWILLPLNATRIRFAHESRSKMSAALSSSKSQRPSGRVSSPPASTRLPKRARRAEVLSSIGVSIMIDSIAAESRCASRRLGLKSREVHLLDTDTSCQSVPEKPNAAEALKIVRHG